MSRILDHQLAEFFDSAFPSTLLERLVRLVVMAYPSAHDQAWQNYSGPVAHDLVGYVLRAQIENGIATLGANTSGARIVAVRNESPDGRDGGHRHYELTCGEVVLTASKIDTPTARIVEARFRTSLAEDSQMAMFDGSQEPQGSHIYACLVHGPGRPQDRTPGFARIAFPRPDGTHAGRPHIDLFLRYPALRPSVHDLPAINIPIENEPEFLPGILPELKPETSDE